MDQTEVTVAQKRKAYLLCIEKGQKLMQKGLAFLKTEADDYRNSEDSRVEYVASARYLHRGFYCPSIVYELFIDNTRRGKKLSRITDKTKYSNRYRFGTDGKMKIAESILEGTNDTKCEYLVYEGDTVLGFSFDAAGTLLGLSEEVYANGMLKSYFYANCLVCNNNSYDFGIMQMRYEEYACDDIGYSDVTIYGLSPTVEDIACDDEIDTLIGVHSFRFIRNDGFLLGVQCKESERAFTYKVPIPVKPSKIVDGFT